MTRPAPHFRALAAACAASLALAALPARADNEGVAEGLANATRIATAQSACKEAAQARGLKVDKADRVKMLDEDRTTVHLQIPSRADIDCTYTASDKTARFAGDLPDFGGSGNTGDAATNALVRACEKVADQKDIRLGRFDEIKKLDRHRVAIKFERALLGRRHTCEVDTARNLVSFDGGKPVSAPVGAMPK